jgi:hypothetical protein
MRENFTHWAVAKKSQAIFIGFKKNTTHKTPKQPGRNSGKKPPGMPAKMRCSDLIQILTDTGVGHHLTLRPGLGR